MWNNAANKGFKDENLLYLEKFPDETSIPALFSSIVKACHKAGLFHFPAGV